MLRISVLTEPGVTRLKFEGKLANEWVEEAKKVWATVGNLNGKSDVLVDLNGVSFVDDAGQELLAEMRHQRAELIGSGPLISALIDEIEDAEVTLLKMN